MFQCEMLPFVLTKSLYRGQRTILVCYGGGGECLPLQVVRVEMGRFSLDRQVRALLISQALGIACFPILDNMQGGGVWQTEGDHSLALAPIHRADKE